MNFIPLPKLVPETDECKSALVAVTAGESDRWVDSVPLLLREHLVSKIPADGRIHFVRISWMIVEE